jgi:deoxycytidylate deaminase
MIVNAGIIGIYYRAGYSDELARDMLAEAGIPMIQIAGSEAEEHREA